MPALHLHCTCTVPNCIYTAPALQRLVQAMLLLHPHCTHIPAGGARHACTALALNSRDRGHLSQATPALHDACHKPRPHCTCAAPDSSHSHIATAQGWTRVEEDGRLLNSHTYSTKFVAGPRWKSEENGRFYEALQQFGTDLTLIAQFLNLDRRQVPPSATRRPSQSCWPHTPACLLASLP